MYSRHEHGVHLVDQDICTSSTQPQKTTVIIKAN